MSKHHGHGHHVNHGHVHHDAGHVAKASDKHDHAGHKSDSALGAQAAKLLSDPAHTAHKAADAKVAGHTNGSAQSIEFSDKGLSGYKSNVFDLSTAIRTSAGVQKVSFKDSGAKHVDITALPNDQLAANALKSAGGGGGKEQTFERTAQTQTTPVGDGNANDGSAKQAADKTPAKPFDGKKSVADLMGDNTIVNKQTDATTLAQKDNVLKLGETPTIKIQYEDQTKDPANPQAKPNFVINKDGSIECLSNPENRPSKEIVVQVQRDAGQTGDATAKQQESLEKLVPYLSQRIAENPDYQKLSQGKVAIDDQQNLLNDKVEASIPNNINKGPIPDAKTPTPDVPQDTGDVSGRMNRVHGSGGGHESFSPNAGGTVPQRDVPPARDNTPPVQAVEDTVSALSGVDKQRPYESVRQRSDGSYGVGRYGMSSGAMCGFFADMLGIDLGDPPDYSKLAKYLQEHPEAMKKLQSQMQQMAKDHKVPQEFADKFNDPKFGEQFAGFLNKLDGKNGPLSPEDVKTFMPKELQETIAQNRVETYAKQMGIDTNKDLKDGDAGKLALAMFLGRKPTESDMTSPQAQKYMSTAENVYKLALAGQFGSDRVDVSEVGGKLVAAAAGSVNQALWAKTPWARYCEGGNLGCAASVSKVLQDTGVLKPGEGSAGVTGLRDVLAGKGWHQVHITDKSQFKPGDVVYGVSGRHGHIGIIGEVQNGQVWVYDNSSSSGTWQHRTIERGGSFVPGGRFGNGLYVMRAAA